MTGPEHYAAAEKILGEVDAIRQRQGQTADEGFFLSVAQLISAAQVHATLAHAAAVAETARDSDGDALVPARSWQYDGPTWAGTAGYPDPEPATPQPDRTTPGEPGPLVECARAIMDRRGEDLSEPIPSARMNDARVVLHAAARWLGDRRRGDVGSLLIREPA